MARPRCALLLAALAGVAAPLPARADASAPRLAPARFALAQPARWELLVHALPFPWGNPRVELALASAPHPIPQEWAERAAALAPLRVPLVSRTGDSAALVPDDVLPGGFEGAPGTVRFRIAGLRRAGVYEARVGEARLSLTYSHPWWLALLVAAAGVLLALVLHRFVGVTPGGWTVEERVATLRARWSRTRRLVARRVPAAAAFDLDGPLGRVLDEVVADAQLRAAGPSDAPGDAPLLERLKPLDAAVDAWPELGDAVRALDLAARALEAERARVPVLRDVPRGETVLRRSDAALRGGPLDPALLRARIASLNALARDLSRRLELGAVARACHDACLDAADREDARWAWYEVWTADDPDRPAHHDRSAAQAIGALRQRQHLGSGALAPPPAPPPGRREAPGPRWPRVRVWRRRAMRAALGVVPLALGLALVTVVKAFDSGRPWGTGFDYLEAFATGFTAQAALTVASALLAPLLAARGAVRE